jgi:RuvB-like protein 1 (pontin 52)
MLDIECFTYLNRALESSISPLVILASNRGNCTIRGTEDIISPHGVPPDLLTRLLIIPTNTYSPDEVQSIIKIRARTEATAISDDAIEQLSKTGVNTSLRYALQLLAPASIIARTNGRQEIAKDDIEEAQDIFIDVKKSQVILSSGEAFIS